MRINKAFKNLIPELSQDEYKQLEENIIKDGLREPILTWKDYIIDGHNRYAICTQHCIKIKEEEIKFKDEEEAKIWIINNQLGRRNLNNWQKAQLALATEEIVAKASKTRMNKGVSNPTPISGEGIKGETAEILGLKVGLGKNIISQAKQIKNKIDAETKIKLDKGEVSINNVYQEIKKKEKQEKRKQELIKQKRQIDKAAQLPNTKYDVIVIDPPWAYDTDEKYDPDKRRIASPYPSMSQEQLKKLNIPSKDNSVIFLWATHQNLWDAKELLDTWGYTYKITMVWDKQLIGMGSWFRCQCEFCLVGIKGKPYWNNKKYSELISEKRREHSRKPEAFYKLVEKITAGKRLDYFARSKRDGWDYYGNEIKF